MLSTLFQWLLILSLFSPVQELPEPAVAAQKICDCAQTSELIAKEAAFRAAPETAARGEYLTAFKTFHQCADFNGMQTSLRELPARDRAQFEGALEEAISASCPDLAQLLTKLR